MRVTRLELDGIGPFEGAVFEFPAVAPGEKGELVLFEGENGSGKTTLLQAIALALQPAGDIAKAPFFFRQRLRDKHAYLTAVEIEHEGQRMRAWRDGSGYRSNSSAANSAVAEQIQRLRDAVAPDAETNWAAYSFASHQATPVIQVNGPQEISVRYLRRALWFGAQPVPARSPTQQPAATLPTMPSAPPLGQLLCNFDYERSRAIAYGSKSSSQSQKLKLDRAASSYEDAISRMQDALSEVLDRRVQFDFQLGQPSPRILFDDQEIPLQLLGEGLRSTFSWLSDLLIQLLLTPWQDKTRSPLDQDFWLLLDEVDQSLHPQMQRRLIPVLRKLFKYARIYATTHSPFVIASAARGHVFSITPDPKTRRVSGPQRAIKLEPGQTLERIISEVFGSPSLFIDEATQKHLADHQQEIDRLRRGQAIDWAQFLPLRDWLWQRTEEVRTVVAMREIAVREKIDEKLRMTAS